MTCDQLDLGTIGFWPIRPKNLLGHLTCGRYFIHATCKFIIISSLWAQVRPVQEKYFHPKEVLITDGILCKEIKNVSGKQPNMWRCFRLMWFVVGDVNVTPSKMN